MTTKREQITKIVLDLLSEKPEGIRYGDLVRCISDTDPSLKRGTIQGTLRKLSRRSDQVDKPSSGLYRHAKFRDSGEKQSDSSFPYTEVKEEDFYQPFADWLCNRGVVTKAIPLGGNRFGSKWGTPDVIGQYGPNKSDIFQFPVEIVSAEIKSDTNQLVTAFGQACAYCLFSHKSYLVVPVRSPEDERLRLESLCQVFGIGLVLFDSENPDNPKFDNNMRVSPRKQSPDLSWTNRYIKSIEKALF